MAKHVENYTTPDPFGYRASSDDWLRRALVRAVLSPENTTTYQRALDLGAGEGFVSENLPAASVWGYDVNPTAMGRFPPNVLKFDPVLHAEKFDLICAMGVIYPFYDTGDLLEMMTRFRKPETHFLIAGVPDWESDIDSLMRNRFGVKKVKTVDIKPYRAYSCQRIRLYKP